MKGGSILSKTPNLFEIFRRQVKEENWEYIGADDSIKILSKDGSYLLFYDRIEGEEVYDYDIPTAAKRSGHIYFYLVECRSEKLFCEILGSVPKNVDVLVCDSNGSLFRQIDLSPDKILL